MKRKEIVILGGIGNGSVIAAAIEDVFGKDSKEVVIKGYLNDRLEIGSNIEGYPVIGTLDASKSLSKDSNIYFINTILKINDNDKRIERVKNLGIPDEKYYSFVHPSAYIASNVEVGHGSIIMPNCTISPGVRIGKNSLVMVSSTIGHNSEIKDFVHIAAQSCVGSYVTIEEGCHIGLNSTIKENVELGELSSIGMGAVLTKSVPTRELWLGCPAKFFKKI